MPIHYTTIVDTSSGQTKLTKPIEQSVQNLETHLTYEYMTFKGLTSADFGILKTNVTVWATSSAFK